MSSRYFITTPIFYVNAAPHLGHLHTAVLADCLHRFHILLGEHKTTFSIGTDEHGLKVQQAALRAGKSEQNFCDDISNKFRNLFKKGGVSYTHFVRTTEEKHSGAVKSFWNTLKDKGHIYHGSYEGWYCTAEERFLSHLETKEIKDASGKITKVSLETGHPVEWMKEQNYMFRLSSFENDLKHWIKSSENVVKPKKFLNALEHMISQGLNDISVSRQRSRVKWGIPVPDDDSQSIYVWLDALVNYLTVSGYPNSNHVWPPDCQVIGKDILRFHGVYWPAFLIAANMEPPRQLLCHSHWTVDHEKMSKSKGNVVDPFEKIDTYTADGVRYFLLREGVPHSDGNYNEAKVQNLLNAELADTLGNLLSRCTAIAINKNQVFPACCDESITLNSRGEYILQVLHELPEKVKFHFQEGNVYLGIEEIMQVLWKTNGFVQDMKPWELAKIPAEFSRLQGVIYIALEVVRVTAILMQPVMPTIAARILNKLYIAEDERLWIHSQGLNQKKRHLSEEKSVVFSRLKFKARA